MNQLSDKDLEFVNKHAHYDVINKQYCFKEEWLAALFAERYAEQQHNAEAVAIYIGDAAGSTSEYGRIQYLVHQGQPLKAGDELFTHAPSQGITRERLIYLVDKAWSSADVNGKSMPEDAADAILAELNPAQETKL